MAHLLGNKVSIKYKVYLRVNYIMISVQARIDSLGEEILIKCIYSL